MATRHLRRIQEQAASLRLADANERSQSIDDDDEDGGDRVSQKPFNPFDLLSDSEEPAQQAEASGRDEDEDDDDSSPAAQPALSQPKPSQTKPAGAGKKASAKKKKKSKPAKQADDGSGDEGPSPSGKGGGKGGKAAKAPATAAAARDVEEDIDAILRELNIPTAGTAAAGAGAGPSGSGAPAAAAAAASSSGGGGGSGSGSVLCVDMKGLRGDEELRRIFGSDVVAAVDRQDRAAAAEARRYAAATRGLGGGGGGGPAGRRRGLGLKRGWLVAPKEHWPPCEGGLSMVQAGSKGGVPVFRYVHSPAYRETQARFYRCQASYDPATIAALLQQAPYHADSLLAMHDLYRHMGENSYAEEMLDRALWALEAAWHPAFQPASAACRLEYGVEENRPLFGALFRHVQALSRRGCHRSALECCKLLLALEPEDPLGGLLLLDYLALRAGRYEWLQRFVLSFEGNRSLALLPNYAFALPLAAARAQQEATAAAAAGAGGGGGGGAAASSAAAARSQPGASSSSGSGLDTAAGSPHDQLVSALLLHPLVLPRLVARLQDKGAAKESYWKELLARRLFSGAGDGGSASLSHLVGLYVERSGELWKPPELLALLRGAAQEAADVAEGKRPPSGGVGAADWAAVARESFPPSASNEYRHLRVADFSDAVNALPREEVEAAVAGGGAMADVEDALAELQEQMIIAAQEEARHGGGGGGAGGANGGAAAPLPEAELRGANPLLMLLRSLLPWVNAGQQPDYGAAEGGGGAGGGAAAAAPPPQPEPEYDEEDGHLSDEEGAVRRVRR